MKRIFKNGRSINDRTASRSRRGNWNNDVNQNNQQNADDKKSTRKRNVDPMVQLNSQILKKFYSLPSDVQCTPTKVSCINSVLARNKDKCGDPARYYGWVLEQAGFVKRTFDFMDVCKKNGLEGCEQAVAEHLVLEGKSVCNNIRMNGLATYSGNLKMFREKLVPDHYRFEKPEEASVNLNVDAHE